MTAYWIRYNVRYLVATALLCLLLYFNFTAPSPETADLANLLWWVTPPYLVLMRFVDRLEVRVAKLRADAAVSVALACHKNAQSHRK